MPDLNIVVCIKVVPKPEEIRVEPETKRLMRENVRSEINPPDMNALEIALKLKDQTGCRVNILAMGHPLFENPLRICLAMGADHVYLLSDPAFAGADTLATIYTLSRGIEQIGGVNLVFCGEESSDGATGQVPPGLAEQLRYSQITMVDSVSIDTEGQIIQGRREIEGGYESLAVPLPAVISVKTAANEPRFINYTLKTWAFEPDQLTIWSRKDLTVDPDQIGVPGSPTTVSGLAQAESRERKRIFLEGTSQEIANQLVEIIDDHL